VDSRRAAAFRLLGIPADSDREAVLRAYRRQARLTHPDVSADPAAADRFAALTGAYRVASQAPGPDREPAPSRPPFAPAQPTPPRPAGPAWSGPRPPIVAGPVRVTPIRPAHRGEGA
jgi:DnaJ domain